MGLLFVPFERDPAVDSQKRKKMIPRYRSLTAIILGEGLNGICSTLHQSLGTLGLNAVTIANAIAMLVIICSIWLLYFDGKLH